MAKTTNSNQTGGGAWDNAASWDNGVPANDDNVNMFGGDTITDPAGDVALTGLNLSIAATGVLEINDASRSFSIGAASTIDGAGTINIGSSGTEYPITSLSQFNGEGNFPVFTCSGGLKLNFYCAQPANMWVRTYANFNTSDVYIDLDTDISADVWASGNTIRLDNIDGGCDSEEHTLAANPTAGGGERMEDGTFADTANWVEGAGWVADGGNATASAGSQSTLTPASNDRVCATHTYEIVIPVSAHNAGQIRPVLGTVAGDWLGGTGNLEWEITSDDKTMCIEKTADADMVLSSVSVKDKNAPSHIQLSTGPTADKVAGSKVSLITRNIQVIGQAVPASGTIGVYGGSDQVLNCEIRRQYYGVQYADDVTFEGTISDCDHSGFYACDRIDIAGVISGVTTYGVIYGSISSFTGLISGCGSYGISATEYAYLGDGDISGCVYGIALPRGPIAANGTYLTGNTQALNRVPGCIFNDLVMSGNTYDILGNAAGSIFNNCTFSSGGTEFVYYNSSDYNSPWNSVKSFNHDGVAGAYKEWHKGGIVTSQTSSPPSGYTVFYRLTTEDADNPCIYEVITIVEPGETITVSGVIRINNADDHTASPTALQLVDPFDDPLYGGGASYLDEDEVAEPDGGVEAGWQEVLASWENTGDIPRVVYVRTFAQHADGEVDTALNIAGTGGGESLHAIETGIM